MKWVHFVTARSLFRSLFMEGWDNTHPAWQEAITVGALDWAFTVDKLRSIATELDALYAYPEAAVASWIAKSCSGLPNGSPDPALTTRAFLVQLRIVVSQMAREWEEHGKPRRKSGR
jgi:hypothetical protein